MNAEQSTFEWRRIAPGHWSGRADNARLTAATLWQLSDGNEFAQTVTAKIGYGGTSAIAYWEAFSREAAIALELIIKAVIAQQMTMRGADPSKEGVPATHDLPALWGQANLPKLSREDRYRLLHFKSVLMWAGRYATPRTVEAWERENKALRELQPPTTKEGRFRLNIPISCGWPEFECLYKIAHQRLWTLRGDWGPQQVFQKGISSSRSSAPDETGPLA